MCTRVANKHIAHVTKYFVYINTRCQVVMASGPHFIVSYRVGYRYKE